MNVFWARATSTSMSAPTVADSGDHNYAQILTYRGVITTGVPWDVTGGGVKAVASTSVTVTSVTTTVANTLIVQGVARNLNGVGGIFSAEANANLTSITERNDSGTTSSGGCSNGGGFAVWDGGMAAAGATGPTTATVTSSINAFLTIALRSQTGPLPFSFRKSITINKAQVGNGGAPATLTDYPMLYNVTDANLKTVANGGNVTDANGDDIAFRAFDSDNPGSNICGAGIAVCTLDHEIEQYDPVTGKLVAWVRIPVLNTQTAGSNTVIYIYYGNSAITTPTAVGYVDDGSGRYVWDTNFRLVYHMNQDPVTATSTTCDGGSAIVYVVCDSTFNNNNSDGLNFPAGALVNEPTAIIGKAINFDGVDDKLDTGVRTTLPADGANAVWTYSAWIKRGSATTNDAIINAGSDECMEWWVAASSVQTVTISDTAGCGTSVNPYAQTGSAPGTNITNLAYTWIENPGTIQFYFNGAAQNAPTSTNTPTYGTCQRITIGARGASSCTPTADPFIGVIDELRISNIARSADWLKTEYNNVNLLCGAATQFCTIGSEQNNPPSAVRMRGARAVAYEGAYAQTVQLKWRTSHEVDHLGFHVYREQNGQLLRVTPSIVAGSALLARGRTELTAGQRYSWWDVLPTGGGPLQYWLEEIDLHGKRTWHGPIAVTSAKGHRDLAKPEQVRSVLLSKLGRGKHKGRLPGAPWQGAADAVTQTPTAAQLAMQAQLAAGPAIKLGVSAEGWYRVDQPTLIAAGLDPKVDPRRLKLFADGIEVPMAVTGAQDGRLEPRDTIEFYGVGLDTPWTDIRTYWLVEGHQAGQRVGANEWRGRAQAGPASFPYTVAWQPRELYFAALRNGEADNFFGPVVSSWPTEQPFTLSYLDPAPPGAARLEVTLQGVTDGPHAVDVQVNGTSVGTATFDGQGQGRTEFSVLSSQLQEGANLVTVVALGGELDVSLVATVRLTYWHTYQAEEDVLRGSVPAGQEVTIGGFSTRPIYVVDVTEPDAVRAVPGQVKRQGSSFAVTVVGPGPGTRTLLAFTDRVAATPAKVQVNQPSRWQSGTNRAQVVMIGHPAFLPSLATLKAWREQQGWTVALIDVEDLYDEFTFGAKSPWALRALVQTARARWAQPPSFLLLGGDASFDPRDFQAMGETDFVPTKLIDTDMMETASDDWFGDLNGDGVAEVAVGRLSVRTAEEATTVVQKLIGYDQTPASRTALLVADTPDSLNFEGASTQLAELLPSGVATQAIYRSRSDDATTRGSLLAAFNSGAWLVNYLGHGSVEVWRGEVFTSLDAGTLTNGLRLPFVATMTCLNGFFHDVWTESLAEALQRAPQGGAVAVWASSSLSEAAEQVDMNRALLQGLSARMTLGEAVAQAKAVARDPNVRRTWILFGDPTTRLK